MIAIWQTLLLSGCTHDVQAPAQPQNNVLFCAPYTDGRKSPYSGELIILMKRVVDAAADQPVIMIRTSAESASKIAGSKWIFEHQSFTFRGERYFLGPMNVRSLELPPGVIAAIAPIGTVDGVTVYAHQPFQSDKPKVLAVRAYTECAIQWFLHVSLVQN